MKVRLATACCFMMMAAPAVAATVQPLAGRVYVDQGRGYAQVIAPAPVAAGAVVMVMVGGEARVVYDDGCTQKVEMGAVAVVAATSPCVAADFTVVDYALVAGGLAVAPGLAAAIELGAEDQPASP
jgi:hypothetical protein